MEGNPLGSFFFLNISKHRYALVYVKLSYVLNMTYVLMYVKLSYVQNMYVCAGVR